MAAASSVASSSASAGGIDRSAGQAPRRGLAGWAPPVRVVTRSIGYVTPYRRQALEVALWIVLSVAFMVGVQKAQQVLVDRALPGFDHPGSITTLLTIMGTVGGAFVAVTLASLRESYLTGWVTGRVVADLRLRLFENVQRLDLGTLSRWNRGDIVSRMTSDLAAIEYAFVGVLAQGFRLVLTFIAAVAAALVLDWRLGALVLGCLPLFFISGHWLGPATARASLERQEELGRSTSTLHENLGAQPVIKAYRLERAASQSFAGDLARVVRASVRLTFLSSLFGASSTAVATALQLLVLGIGGFMVIHSELSLGTLFALLGLMGLMVGPVQNFSALVQLLQRASGAMERVDELLGAVPAVAEPDVPRVATRLTRDVQFDDVWFAYSDGRVALGGLTMTIQARTLTAIVGPSGSGKSTALGLIPRLYDPQRGAVLFDDVDLCEMSLTAVRSQVGYVFQDSVLFGVSIRENIRMGRLGASDEAVEAAARAAEVHDAILGLPLGYDTVVGERGEMLSGGQRQRIAIARAIISDPALLILDEATSALDAPSEATILRTLRGLTGRCTIVVVTHRIASLSHADHIMVLDQGRLVEQGSHESLLASRGLYGRLWTEQLGGQVLSAPAIGEKHATNGHRVTATLRVQPDQADIAERLMATMVSALARQFDGEGQVNAVGTVATGSSSLDLGSRS